MFKLILALAFFLNQQDKPPEKCTISGTAVDALTGKALNKADVFVVTPGEPYGDAARTDAKGNFTIKDLDPGRYFLAARATVIWTRSTAHGVPAAAKSPSFWTLGRNSRTSR